MRFTVYARSAERHLLVGGIDLELANPRRPTLYACCTLLGCGVDLGVLKLGGLACGNGHVLKGGGGRQLTENRRYRPAFALRCLLSSLTPANATPSGKIYIVWPLLRACPPSGKGGPCHARIPRSPNFLQSWQPSNVGCRHLYPSSLRQAVRGRWDLRTSHLARFL